MEPLLVAEARRRAAQLLQGVVMDSLTARQALAQWPHGVDDPSVLGAYQALWFFEADEDRHRAEPFYLDVQLTLLKELIAPLSQGQPVPITLLAAYRQQPSQARRAVDFGWWHDAYVAPTRQALQALWDTYRRFARLWRDCWSLRQR